jgi:hypothetical protein
LKKSENKDEGGRRKDEKRPAKHEPKSIHPSSFILHPSMRV